MQGFLEISDVCMFFVAVAFDLFIKSNHNFTFLII